jgi:K+-sensing histidine kinase KdpD
LSPAIIHGFYTIFEGEKLMKKKHLLAAVITLMIETALTFLISFKFSIRFIELMFFVGIACTTIIVWFSSSGGMITNMINSINSAKTQYIQEREEFTFRRGPAFYASFLFLFVGFIFFVLLVSGIIPPVRN